MFDLRVPISMYSYMVTYTASVVEKCREYGTVEEWHQLREIKVLEEKTFLNATFPPHMPRRGSSCCCAHREDIREDGSVASRILNLGTARPGRFNPGEEPPVLTEQEPLWAQRWSGRLRNRRVSGCSRKSRLVFDRPTLSLIITPKPGLTVSYPQWSYS